MTKRRLPSNSLESQIKRQQQLSKEPPPPPIKLNDTEQVIYYGLLEAAEREEANAEALEGRGQAPVTAPSPGRTLLIAGVGLLVVGGLASQRKQKSDRSLWWK